MRITLATAILMLAAGSCAAQDKMAEAIRKGIVEEDTNHNLSAAIEDYQSVVAQYDGERQAAATALFRLAECYRKLGKNDQATAAYKRVVQEFADQTKLAEQSRNHLPKAQETGGVARDDARFEWEKEMVHRARVAEARSHLRAFLAERLSDAEAPLRKATALGAPTEQLKEKVMDLRQQLAAFDLETAQEIPMVPPRPH